MIFRAGFLFRIINIDIGEQKHTYCFSQISKEMFKNIILQERKVVYMFTKHMHLTSPFEPVSTVTKYLKICVSYSLSERSLKQSFELVH